MVAFLALADDLPPNSRIVGFAALNTLIQTGSFLGPTLWGLAAERTGSFKFALAVIPFLLLGAGAIVLATRFIVIRPSR